MYSYEDRVRAVKLYIKLGKRTGATICQLGYPTKNALKSWHREFERSRDLPRRYARSKPKYSDEHKRLAVDHYLDHGRCMTVTIKTLGYPGRDTLAAWIADLHPDAAKRLVGRAGSVPRPAGLKRAAVIELCTRQGSATEVAEQMGVSRPTLYNWKNQLLGREIPASMKRPADLPPEPQREELERQLESLRRDVRNLQLEHDLLKKANELLKKGLGVDLQLLTNREKTRLVDALRQTHALPGLLARLELARSSYFYHRARLEVADKYVDVRRAMTDIFERNYRCYGYRRLHASLSNQSVNISEKVVRRLMKQQCLIAATSKRRRYGSYMGEISPAPDNLLDRDFGASAPNEKWLTDITEFQIPAGKVYLSPMIDCFDGMVVSWSIGNRPTRALIDGGGFQTSTRWRSSPNATRQV